MASGGCGDGYGGGCPGGCGFGGGKRCRLRCRGRYGLLPRCRSHLPPRGRLRPGEPFRTPGRALGGGLLRGRSRHRLQFLRHLLGVRPLFGVRRQQSADQRPERSGPSRFGRLGGEDRGGRVLGGGPPERGRALHGGVQQHAQGPQVGRGPGDAARQPLGGDERGRTGQLPVVRAVVRGRLVTLGGGDAEVGEDDSAVLGDQHVGRPHVPVHDAHGVRGAQGAEEGEADSGGFTRLDRAAPERLVQGLAGQQLHDDPRESVQQLRRVEFVGALRARAFVRLLGLHDDVEDGDGGGMVDPGCGAGLAMEPVGRPPVALVLRVAGQPWLSDGDFTPFELVVGPPYGAGGAGADALHQPVPPADQPALGGVRPAPVVAHAPSVPCEAVLCRRGSGRGRFRSP